MDRQLSSIVDDSQLSEPQLTVGGLFETAQTELVTLVNVASSLGWKSIEKCDWKYSAHLSKRRCWLKINVPSASSDDLRHLSFPRTRLSNQLEKFRAVS